MNIESTLRRTILTLTLVGFGLTLTFSACDFLDPSPNATVFEPDLIDQECDDVTLLQTGSVIYRCECASCHGLDGVSLTDQITDIRGFSSFQKFNSSLNNGPGSMPAYPQLDSSQRRLLFEYVQDSL